MVFMMLTGSVCSQLCFLRVARTLVTFKAKKRSAGQVSEPFYEVCTIPAFICYNQELTNLSRVTVIGDAKFLGYRARSAIITHSTGWPT